MKQAYLIDRLKDANCSRHSSVRHPSVVDHFASLDENEFVKRFTLRKDTATEVLFEKSYNQEDMLLFTLKMCFRKTSIMNIGDESKISRVIH